jgi:hypothetical protein
VTPRRRSNCATACAIFCHQIGLARASSHHTVKCKVKTPARYLKDGREDSTPAESVNCEACEMVSTDGRDNSGRAALTVASEVNKEANKGMKKAAASRPSPADKLDVDRDEPVIRAGRLQVQAQRSQKLHEYYDEALAEIRASLERAPER